MQSHSTEQEETLDIVFNNLTATLSVAVRLEFEDGLICLIILCYNICMSLRSKIRVGVVRGGPSKEHEVSIKTGAHVLKHLPEDYIPVDIFIDKNGVWHLQGVEKPIDKILSNVDVIFNASHGEFGEDGKLSRILDMFHVPYTGSKHLSSVFAMHKEHSKNFLKAQGIKTPFHKVLKNDDPIRKNLMGLWRTILNPSVIKPMTSGSSVGVSVVRNFVDLEKALNEAFEHSDKILIEEYIRGREATCGVVDSYRGEDVYALFPVEVVLPESSSFHDYDAKYGGKTKYVAPGRFSEIEKYNIQEMAKKVHKSLGLRHYSRSDFIVSPTRGVFFLEVNSLPYLAKDSAYVGALNSNGMEFSHFLDHVIRLALKSHSR